MRELREFCEDKNWLGFHTIGGAHSAFRHSDPAKVVVSFGGNPEALPGLTLENRADFNAVLRSVGRPELPE